MTGEGSQVGTGEGSLVGTPKWKAARKAKASGSGTADPGELDPKEESPFTDSSEEEFEPNWEPPVTDSSTEEDPNEATNPFEEWLEYVNDSRRKRVSVEKEVIELGKSMARVAVINLDFLDVILKDVQDALWVVLFQSHRVDIVHEFSDFLSFLPTFKKSYDKTIADIEHGHRAPIEGSKDSPRKLVNRGNAGCQGQHHVAVPS